MVMDSKLSAGSLRFFLFADVLADLLQLEPDGGYGITPRPEMLAGEISLFTAQPSYGDGTLALEKPDHRGPRVLRRNRYTHMHRVRHQVPIQNLALLLPGPSVEYFSPWPTGFSKQYLAPSLGNEHDMVFAVPL